MLSSLKETLSARNWTGITTGSTDVERVHPEEFGGDDDSSRFSSTIRVDPEEDGGARTGYGTSVRRRHQSAWLNDTASFFGGGGGWNTLLPFTRPAPEEDNVDGEDTKMKIKDRVNFYISLKPQLVLFIFLHTLTSILIFFHFGHKKWRQLDDKIPLGAPHYWQKHVSTMHISLTMYVTFHAGPQGFHLLVLPIDCFVVSQYSIVLTCAMPSCRSCLRSSLEQCTAFCTRWSSCRSACAETPSPGPAARS